MPHYKLTEIATYDVYQTILDNFKDEMFIVADIAKLLKRDPSALSPHIHKLKEENKIKIIGVTYKVDKKGNNQQRRVYMVSNHT